jgi:hypothetical protein
MSPSVRLGGNFSQEHDIIFQQDLMSHVSSIIRQRLYGTFPDGGPVLQVRWHTQQPLADLAAVNAAESNELAYMVAFVH